jgi:hypothetical protein
MCETGSPLALTIVTTRASRSIRGNLDPDEYPPDKNIKTDITYAQYLSSLSMYWRDPSPSHPGMSDRRVIVIPIVKKGQYDNGRDTIKIDRFGAFFMRDRVGDGNGGDIQMEYINDRIVMGDGGYIPGGGATNSLLTVAVLYR